MADEKDLQTQITDATQAVVDNTRDTIKQISSVVAIVKQAKWKSPYLWLGFAGAAKIILNAFGVKIDDAIWNGVLNVASALLIALGVWNNPSSKDTW